MTSTWTELRAFIFITLSSMTLISCGGGGGESLPTNSSITNPTTNPATIPTAITNWNETNWDEGNWAN